MGTQTVVRDPPRRGWMWAIAGVRIVLRRALFAALLMNLAPPGGGQTAARSHNARLRETEANPPMWQPISPDGHFLLLVRELDVPGVQRRWLVSLDLRSGRQGGSVPIGVCYALAWRPDGKAVLIYEERKGGSRTVCRLAPSLRAIWSIKAHAVAAAWTRDGRYVVLASNRGAGPSERLVRVDMKGHAHTLFSNTTLVPQVSARPSRDGEVWCRASTRRTAPLQAIETDGRTRGSVGPPLPAHAYLCSVNDQSAVWTHDSTIGIATRQAPGWHNSEVAPAPRPSGLSCYAGAEPVVLGNDRSFAPISAWAVQRDGTLRRLHWQGGSGVVWVVPCADGRHILVVWVKSDCVDVVDGYTGRVTRTLHLPSESAR
ncbi:MAG TPA: hypothetical protein VFJ58_12795 [Armatimonadota bacterium]|nr:hypothetical protein [Armatimonadota bacterium]